MHKVLDDFLRLPKLRGGDAGGLHAHNLYAVFLFWNWWQTAELDADQFQEDNI